jgi:adenylate cyclase
MATIHAFGPFRLDAEAEILFRGAEPLPVGKRAVALLRVLVERPGAPVSKDALIEAAWSGFAVEESNLPVQIGALRRVLGNEPGGESWIETLPRRGYRYIGPAITNGGVPISLALPDKPSIAVLPFQNMSGDANQDYFADGMVEEIITALSRIKWLFVIARNSSFTYKGRAVDVKQVGRELGVRYVLEGSVRKAGDRMRITGQLIDAVTGAHLWAEHFDGLLEDVFVLQDRVAISVAGVIEPALQAAEIRRSEDRPTNDLAAYDLYLRSLALTFSWERSSIIQAIDLLEQAIERDPSYGPALALAAMCYQNLHMNGWSKDQEADCRLSIDLARRAIRVGSDDPFVLSASAHALGYFEENINPAIALVDRSLELNPSSATSWYRSGTLRLWAGQPELAIQHFETSLRLNPRRKGPSLFGIGLGHFFTRRFDQAADLLLQSLQETPNWTPTYRFLASCYAQMDRLDEARKFVEQLRRITPIVVPSAVSHWPNPEHRALYLEGLRMAAGGMAD